jgi:hypothetical protein
LNFRTLPIALICFSIFSAAIGTRATEQGAAIAQSAATKAQPAPKAKPTSAGHAHPASAALTPAINAYLNRLRPKLYSNWLLPDGNNNVKIVATLEASGTTEGVQVTSNPKSDAAEQAASDAFSKAQPLEGLPSGLERAKLVLDFVSKADPHGDSSSNIATSLEQLEKTASGPGAPNNH